MFGEAVLRRVISDVVVGPSGERIDLDNRSHEVVVYERSRPAARGVRATEPGHPGGCAAQGALQRFDFAGRAARVGVRSPDVSVEVRGGANHSDVQAKAIGQMVGKPLGLGEQVAGVEQGDLCLAPRCGPRVRSLHRRSWQ